MAWETLVTLNYLDWQSLIWLKASTWFTSWLLAICWKMQIDNDKPAHVRWAAACLKPYIQELKSLHLRLCWVGLGEVWATAFHITTAWWDICWTLHIFKVTSFFKFYINALFQTQFLKCFFSTQMKRWYRWLTFINKAALCWFHQRHRTRTSITWHIPRFQAFSHLNTIKYYLPWLC